MKSYKGVTICRTSFAKFARWAGIDFHILHTLIFRGWSVLAGITTVLLIPIFLEPVKQGYYYTFASLIALQIFFELGFSQVIVQIVSHDAAHFSPKGNYLFAGDQRCVARVTYLIQSLTRWYKFIALVFFLLVGVGGFYFFDTQRELAMRSWLGPWIAVVFATAVNLYWSPLLGVVEGLGKVGDVARLRLLQSIVGSTLAWIVLALGGGLWAVVFVPAASGILTGWWVKSSKNILNQFNGKLACYSLNLLNWRSEIFPFQWRIAVSWISGYFIFQLFTPVVFRTQGAIEAGRLGVSLSIFSAISSVGMSWVAARVPAMAGAIARGERDQLNAIFKSVSVRCTVFVIWFSAVFVVAIASIGFAYPALAAKISPVPVLIILALATSCNSLVFSAAAYMRAHKEEPLLKMSIVGGFLTIIAVYIGSRFSTVVTVAGYAFVSVFISLPWTISIFKKYWHRK